MALAAGIVLAGALAFGLPAGRDVLVSSLLLVHITRPLQPGLLHRLTEPPSRESVMFPGGGRTMAATLYRSASASGGAAVILIHGVNEQGKDDPRIVWLADLLARAGFTVLTPDFLGFKSLTLRTSDVEELVASVLYLATRSDGERPRRIGLIGFSYGAGPALVAAADARVRDRVQFVVSFGGYYNLVNVITFITTGYYEFEGAPSSPPSTVAGSSCATTWT
jgi:pimeloyl-ACP methyl ester carboxylesterase